MTPESSRKKRGRLELVSFSTGATALRDRVASNGVNADVNGALEAPKYTFPLAIAASSTSLTSKYRDWRAAVRKTPSKTVVFPEFECVNAESSGKFVSGPSLSGAWTR